MEINEVLDHLELTLLDDIQAMTAKDRAAFWANIKEFNTAKLQRQAFRQTSDIDTEFTIQIVNSRDELTGD